MPQSFRQLADTMQLLERHYREMQDIEFTIERGTLYLLQTRTGKRTAAAALKVARDLVDEGLISRDEALERIDPDQLDQLLHPTIDPSAERDVIAHGLNASPGAAVGAVVFDADTAEARGKDGQDVILVRVETTPDDIHGVVAAQGVLTARGGMTSHAAVVARGLGKPCVAGAEEIDVDAEAAAVPRGRRRGTRGRRDHDRRRARRGDARRDAAGAAAGQRGLPHDHRLGGRGAAAARARQRRYAGRRRQGARAGRRGHRPLPHRAHVLRRRAAAGGAAHDPGVRRGRPAGGAGRAAALPAERLRGDPRGDGRAAGDDPPARSAAARVPARPRRPGGRARPAARLRRGRRRGGAAGARQGPRRGAARAEPDARHPRLPAGAAASGDLRDAGTRHRPRRAGPCRAPRSRSCTRWSASPRSCGACGG